MTKFFKVANLSLSISCVCDVFIIVISRAKAVDVMQEVSDVLIEVVRGAVDVMVTIKSPRL